MKKLLFLGVLVISVGVGIYAVVRYTSVEKEAQSPPEIFPMLPERLP